ARHQLPGEAPFLRNQLDNNLQAQIGYTRSVDEVAPRAGVVGQPLEQFLRLNPMVSTPSPPDTKLTFQSEPLKGVAGKWDIVRAIWLKRGDKPALFGANAREVRRMDVDAAPIHFPGGDKGIAPSDAGVVAVDWNNDFLMDILLARAGGLR